MATHFERQLEELHVQMITMGSLCEKVISLSNRAIRGENCIREIFDTDREIDTKEREIENHCMRILLHQQPVARDLREVSAALKMISDMERIGDQAADIADLSQFIENEPCGGSGTDRKDGRNDCPHGDRKRRCVCKKRSETLPQSH